MSQFTSALSYGESHAQTMVPKTFIVDGDSTEHSCLVDTGSFESEHTASGRRAKHSMVLGFIRTAAYSPAVGDRLTVDGVVWVVSAVRSGPVKHELTLISDDE